MLEEAWINYSKEFNFKYILLLKDLEDKDLYPVYFHNYDDMKEYIHSLISESKIEVVNTFDMTKYSKKYV